MNILSRLFHREQKTKTQLFDTVIGYDDIKEVLSLSLQSKEPVNIMLSGPPASGKTLFLLDILAANRSTAHYIDGSGSTKAGLFDYCFTNRPKFLLIDEIDGLPKKDQKALLNLLETGILKETKIRKTRETVLKCWVWATLNDPNKLLPALKSRFQPLYLPEYTRDQFIEVGTRLLERMGLSQHGARTITTMVYDQMGIRDPRQVIRLGKMANAIDTEEIDMAKLKRIITTLIKYGGPTNGNVR